LSNSCFGLQIVKKYTRIVISEMNNFVLREIAFKSTPKLPTLIKANLKKHPMKLMKLKKHPVKMKLKKHPTKMKLKKHPMKL